MLKILHITNEITKKNFSISSLINFICDNGNKNFFFKSEVFCANTDIKKNSSLLVHKIRWKNFFFLKKIFSEITAKYDAIHIHGIWAPIQLYSIILCMIYSKKTIIHPHGMLLKPAINDHGFFKRINKRIFLFLLKILIYNQKNIIFIAITNEEFKEIKKLFSGIKVKLIQNNIPFENFNPKLEQSKKHNKTFVFFGRIHPHKNIIQMMELFVNTGLANKGWSLEIYGIHDDQKYLVKIKKFQLDYPQIKILNPVFGLKKANIINKSWANILISKSEVLSFSVLESGVYGLPSIITSNIETLKDDCVSQKVSNNPNKILNKFKEISEWSDNQRKNIGKKTSNFFNIYKSKSDRNFLDSLSDTYNDIFKREIKSKGKSSENFYIASMVQSLNVFLPNIILLFSFLTFQSSLAAEIGLTNIIFITLTQMLSGNVRLIAIRKQNIDILQNNLIFRMLMGAFFLIFYIFFSLYFSAFEYYKTTFIVSCLIVLLWCSELVLSIYEIKRFIGKLVFILLFYIVFITLIFFSFFYSNLEIVQLSMFLSCLALLLFCFLGINFKNFQLTNLNLYKSLSSDFLKYISSLSLTLSSFCWRFYLYFTYSKEVSGTIFIAFAICSFPGTFFNNVLGPNFFYNKISINLKIKYFFILIFVFLIMLNTIDFKIIDLNIVSENELFYHIIKISSIGSFLMLYGMYVRQDLLFKKKISLNNLFYKDIIYGLILILVLPLLDFIGKFNLLSYSYLVGSIFAVLIFKSSYGIRFSRNSHT
jgi:glycosyltransferase involved in cell wall biosynthesis